MASSSKLDQLKDAVRKGLPLPNLSEKELLEAILEAIIQAAGL